MKITALIAAMLALVLPAGAFADGHDPPAEEAATPSVTCGQGAVQFSVSGPEGTPAGSFSITIRQGQKQVATLSGTGSEPIEPVWLQTGVYYTVIVTAPKPRVSKSLRQIYVLPGAVRVFVFYPAGRFTDEPEPVVVEYDSETVLQCTEGGWIFRAVECQTRKGGHQIHVPVTVEITISRAGKVIKRLIASGGRRTPPFIAKAGLYTIKFYVPKYKLTDIGKIRIRPGMIGPFGFSVNCG